MKQYARWVQFFSLILVLSLSNNIHGQEQRNNWFIAPHVAYNSVYHQEYYGLSNGNISPALIGVGFGTKGKFLF